MNEHAARPLELSELYGIDVRERVTAAPAKRRTPSRARVDESADQRLLAEAEKLGTSRLSEDERAVIRAILQGRDGLASVPGSLDLRRAVEMAALLLPQPVVIISPRVTILRERYEHLLTRRVPVVCIDPAAGSVERAQALGRVARGGSLLVYATPDTLGARDAVAAFASAGIGQVMIADAHLLSARAHELGVAYASLPADLERLGRPPVIGESAAVPLALRQELVAALGLRAPVFLEHPPHRPNLLLETLVVHSEFKFRRLEGLLTRLRRPGLVLCGSAEEAERLYGELRALRLPVHRYHSALEPGERGGELVNFTMPGRRAIMVAVSAYTSSHGIVGLREAAERDRLPTHFGLGLRKRDLRFVIHYRTPASLEQYVREIDFCAQDGQPGECVMLYDPADREIHLELQSRQRIRGSAWTRVGHVLAELARHGRPDLLEPMLVSTGLDARVAETVVVALANAGLVAQMGPWVKTLATGPELIAHSGRIAALTDRFLELDRARLDAVAAYANNGDCRSRLLAHYFGAGRTAACGVCSSCTGARPALSNPGEPTLSIHGSRRPPAREFGVTAIGPASVSPLLTDHADPAPWSGLAGHAK